MRKLSQAQLRALRLLADGPLYYIAGGLFVRRPIDWHEDRMSVIDNPEAFSRRDTLAALQRMGYVARGAECWEMLAAGRAALEGADE